MILPIQCLQAMPWLFKGKADTATYSVKKRPEAVAKGYLNDSCIRIWVLFYDNFGSRNCVGLIRIPILLTQKLWVITDAIW